MRSSILFVATCIMTLVSASPFINKRSGRSNPTTVVKVVNHCDQTIQLGVLENSHAPGLPTPISKGSFQSYTYHGARSGRFWARENCEGHACQIAGAAFPISLAEFTFDAAGGIDYYDISFLDGYNLPLSITPINPDRSRGSGQFWCGAPKCATTSMCPQELQLKQNDVLIGCQSACSKFGNPEYCYSCTFNTPDKCPINHYSQIIKNYCHNAYSFAYDDKNSLYQCSAPSYTITFCP